MSASLIAALLGLLCISLTEKTHSLDVFHESKESFNSGAKSRSRFGYSASANARIVNGSIATMNEYPWMVALFKNKAFFCGGSIISNQFILTAAHCVRNTNAKDFIVSLGDHILYNESETKSQNYQIEEIIIHEDRLKSNIQFNINSFQNLAVYTSFNDIALLKVKGIIELNENVSPICLSKSEEEHIREIATATGWGRTENGLSSNILKKAQVRVVNSNNSKCKQKNSNSSLLSIFYYPTLCTEEVTGNIYHGDSGGPVFIKNKRNKWEQIGINCCGFGNPDSPAFYTRVSNFLQWIESKTGPIDRSNC